MDSYALVLYAFRAISSYHNGNIIPFLKNLNSYHLTSIVGTDGRHSKMIAGISVTIRLAMKTY